MTDTLPCYQYFAGGEWRDPAAGQYLDSDDPYSGRTWARIPRCDATDVDVAVSAAQRAFTDARWSNLSPTARGRLVHRLGDSLIRHADTLAEVETRDNGKRSVDILPGLKDSLAESFYYYAGIADKIEGAVIPTGQSGILNYTRHEPFGPVAAITAWNSPLLIAIWKLAPALAAGNTVVLKPSEHASVSTLELMNAFADADLPPGVINEVTGLGHEAGQALVSHPQIHKVSFTGSSRGGKQVAEIAAAQVKNVTMELGGKSPQIVFDDAELDGAVNGVLGGIFPPAGQSCIAGSRLLLQSGIYDRFIERALAVANNCRLGDPRDPTTHVGPIANRMQHEFILDCIDSAKNDGATLLLGGDAVQPEGSGGWFVKPTVFTNVTPAMRIFREEIFGPVLAVTRFATTDEAIKIANDTFYGLAAGVWTGDTRRGIELADRIDAGTVYINNYFNACTMSPVGGWKQSGYGRENGWEGIGEFLQTKSIWLSTAQGVDNPFP